MGFSSTAEYQRVAFPAVAPDSGVLDFTLSLAPTGASSMRPQHLLTPAVCRYGIDNSHRTGMSPFFDCPSC